MLVMVAGYSRVITSRMLPTRTAENLFAGMWALLAGWVRYPRCWCGTTILRSGRGRLPVRPPLESSLCVFGSELLNLVEADLYYLPGMVMRRDGRQVTV